MEHTNTKSGKKLHYCIPGKWNQETYSTSYTTDTLTTSKYDITTTESEYEKRTESHPQKCQKPRRWEEVAEELPAGLREEVQQILDFKDRVLFGFVIGVIFLEFISWLI